MITAEARCPTCGAQWRDESMRSPPPGYEIIYAAGVCLNGHAFFACPRPDGTLELATGPQLVEATP